MCRIVIRPICSNGPCVQPLPGRYGKALFDQDAAGVTDGCYQVRQSAAVAVEFTGANDTIGAARSSSANRYFARNPIFSSSSQFGR